MMTHSRALTGLLLFCVLLVSTPALAADTPEQIKAKIEVQNQKIQALEAEIAKFEAELVAIGKNKSTLQSEVTRIDTSRKKIAKDIALTQSKIQTAGLEIERLSGQIKDTSARIDTGIKAVSESLRTLLHLSDTTLVEIMLSSGGADDAWAEADRVAALNTHIANEIKELSAARDALTDTQAQTTATKNKLTSLSNGLKDQKSVLDENRKEQASLLSATKNKESEYQKLLEEKKLARIQFEQELNQYESALKYSLDPSSLPTVGTGVLKFPFSVDFMNRCKDRQKAFGNPFCITQYFGNTSFAQSGAYNGSGHNGIDFGSPDGTTIVAALSGTVQATGNTDQYPGCYSYGKWVLIKHGNGLSTLYAHLSLVSVSPGEALPTGATVGYSGHTGYATGPHLHFSLFASDGVKLVQLGDIKAKTNCARATVPVAPTSAYLDPMTYL